MFQSQGAEWARMAVPEPQSGLLCGDAGAAMGATGWRSEAPGRPSWRCLRHPGRPGLATRGRVPHQHPRIGPGAVVVVPIGSPAPPPTQDCGPVCRAFWCFVCWAPDVPLLCLFVVLDVLMQDYPNFFVAKPRFDIYHDDIELRDDSTIILKGLPAYKLVFQVRHSAG